MHNPRSAISQVLREARASLAEPSRPFTPSEPVRHLGGASGLLGQRAALRTPRSGEDAFQPPPTPGGQLGSSAFLEGAPSTPSVSTRRQSSLPLLSKVSPLPPSSSSPVSSPRRRPGSVSRAKSEGSSLVAGGGADVLQIEERDDDLKPRERQTTPSSAGGERSMRRPRRGSSARMRASTSSQEGETSSGKGEREEAATEGAGEGHARVGSAKRPSLPPRPPTSSSTSSSPLNDADESCLAMLRILSQLEDLRKNGGGTEAQRHKRVGEAMDSLLAMLIHAEEGSAVFGSASFPFDSATIDTCLRSLYKSMDETANHLLLSSANAILLVLRISLKRDWTLLKARWNNTDNPASMPGYPFYYGGAGMRKGIETSGDGGGGTSGEGSGDETDVLSSAMAAPVPSLPPTDDTLSGHPTAQALASTFKLVYRLSKRQENDSLFRRQKFIETLCLTSLALVRQYRVAANLEGPGGVNLAEIVVHALGALKNISQDEGNQKMLTSVGALAAVIEMTEAVYDRSRKEDPAGVSTARAKQQGSYIDWRVQAIVQVTIVLRNLAAHGPTREQFAIFGGIEAIGPILRDYLYNQEITLNIVRVLAQLCTYKDLASEIEKEEGVLARLRDCIDLHENVAPLLVRAGYVLAYICSTSDDARDATAKDGGLERVLQKYNSFFEVMKRRWKREKEASADEKSSSEGGAKAGAKSNDVYEVIMRVTRLLANIAMKEEWGVKVGSDDLVVEDVLAFLEDAPFEKREELMLNLLGLLSNISYYGKSATALWRRCDRLCAIASAYSCVRNDEAVVEALRLISNIAITLKGEGEGEEGGEDEDEQKAAAKALIDEGGLEAMFLLLDHNNMTVVYHALGALINAVASPLLSPAFVEFEMGARLGELLERLDMADAKQLPVMKLTIQCLSNVLASSKNLLKAEHVREMVPICKDVKKYAETLMTSEAAESEEIDTEMLHWTEESAALVVAAMEAFLENAPPAPDSEWEELPMP